MADIWRSVKNPEMFYGNNADLNEFNKAKGGTMLIENETAIKVVNDAEEGIPIPAVVMTNKEKKTEKKKITKGIKIVNIEAIRNGVETEIAVSQAEPEAPMRIPTVIGNNDNSLGYGSPSMIQGGEQGDIDKRMRQCLTKEDREEQEHQEELLPPAPPVVGK